MEIIMNNTDDFKEIYLAGGCFWGTEKYLSGVKGIVTTAVGYANGNTENPSYEEVCHNNTGHAETVKVVYDPSRIRLEFILRLYYDVIDPTSLNRQGEDKGSQYRTGIYYVDEKDKEVIEKSLTELQTHYEKPVVVEALPLSNFYLAEEYHQKYLDKNPTGYCHIPRAKFAQAELAKDDFE
jgi:peptide-methionine (S)-S-oxide reductase/peptide methionine sulfoxide reductase msrA/msrB